MPLSGGAAAAAFAPVADGPRELHRRTPTRTSSLPGITLELTIEDDQFNSNLTTPAVEGLIDNTQVHLFTGDDRHGQQPGRARPAERGVLPAAVRQHRRADLG